MTTFLGRRKSPTFGETLTSLTSVPLKGPFGVSRLGPIPFPHKSTGLTHVYPLPNPNPENLYVGS